MSPAVHALLAAVLLSGGEPDPAGDAERGYRFLRTAPLLPPDFDAATLDATPDRWPAALRDGIDAADADERRTRIFERYGLVVPPADDPVGGAVLGYMETPDGWVMNCFACHAGTVAGRSVPGLPNARYMLETLTEDVRAVKLATGKPLSHQDLALFRLPLGGSRGTTNAVVFGVVLDALRRPDMSVDLTADPGELVHHDVDPPPWWHAKKKSRLYIDGFSPKNHRVLMQFMLLPGNDRETVLSWEDPFRDVLAYIESVEPPPWPWRTGPWEIDEGLADRGRTVFERNCAECHGTYAAAGSDAVDTYPERTVPIGVVGTDPVRLHALSPAHRAHLSTTWMSRYGADPVVTDPGGYVAPPLDGVWATAPYFHNGSVPTLHHVLNPSERPVVWRRTDDGDGYDHHRIGLAVREFVEVPAGHRGGPHRREYFDTRRTDTGKSAAGHEFAEVLSAAEKRAVLEYLKTL